MAGSSPAMTHPRTGQHLTRFCSRSTACLTPLEARGYFRVTSPSAAHAASLSFNAASDCPSRSKASGAFADLSNLVVTPRKASAASRYCWRWKKLSPSQYCESATRASLGYFCTKLRIVLALHIADAKVELVPRRRRRRQGGQRSARAWASRRRRQRPRRVARTAGVRQIERLAGAASTGSADRCPSGKRKLTATEGLRRPRGIRALAGIEGIATAPALGRAGRRCLRV